MKRRGGEGKEIERGGEGEEKRGEGMVEYTCNPST
jgi:hypothetical protein